MTENKKNNFSLFKLLISILFWFISIPFFLILFGVYMHQFTGDEILCLLNSLFTPETRIWWLYGALICSLPYFFLKDMWMLVPGLVFFALAGGILASMISFPIMGIIVIIMAFFSWMFNLPFQLFSDPSNYMPIAMMISFDIGSIVGIFLSINVLFEKKN
ncbi:hypothetical protein KHC33_04185 [Methanospirillum sp. J.3.6.1-F.2.7.3]|uniref:Uncharacterized protein n=1 Tax=Methanospirillum purgamenti TaxID=2834276 RepID=A0A8E7B3K1_9EURY|nr:MULTISPECIES: hypothetical protein [Methanospirillum]MDX8551760.1 hypothetical protein [Methanospirillum hungatei]QVV89721.1 hypothetical protein KHC33_04185 [Methanospirillum sp. J.3.6.1-F.2.7.3]